MVHHPPATAVGSPAATVSPPVVGLPNNLGTQFGGIDITKGFRNPNFVRPGLWNLGGLNDTQYEYQDVYYGTANEKCAYQVLEFLAFVWGSQLNVKTITGETKSDHQHQLSNSFTATIAVAGFALEIQDAFEEDSMVETYHKYASIYARHQIYRVSILNTPADLQPYLSDRARRLFAGGDANAIVDTFGTHYITSATFGGMRRFASSLDVRDESVSDKLGQALNLKFAAEIEAGNASGSAGSTSSDATVQKIHNSMDVKNSIVIGGTFVGDGDTWIPSLCRNPSAIDFELASVADLILDPKIKADVQALIDSRTQISQVTSTALALVMWESLGDKRLCISPLARSDPVITTATVNRKQGWYMLGQYGIGYDVWDPTGSKGLLIRNIPGSTQQLVKKPDSIQTKWDEDYASLHEMASNDPDFHALSGFLWTSDSGPISGLDTDRAAMVHRSLTTLASDGGRLWYAADPFNRNPMDVYRVDYGPSDDDSSRILQLPDGAPEAYFFHTKSPTDSFWHKLGLRKLDFTKVQFVSNTFLDSLALDGSFASNEIRSWVYIVDARGTYLRS